MDRFNEHRLTMRDRRPWEPPEVKTVGTIAEIVQTGGGKLCLVGGDPGESRKEGPVG